MGERTEARVFVVDPKGVHIRTGQLLCARLRRGRFDADLTLSCERGVAFIPRVTSLMPIAPLRAGARFGDEVRVRSEGPDSAEVVRVVREVLEHPAPCNSAVLLEALAQVSGAYRSSPDTLGRR